MGVRFARRIRICKGVHLNVSRSGIGISLGMRGASISTGPRGSYVNLGIPGTGIAYRQKINGTSAEEPKYLKESDIKEHSYITGSHLKIQIDDNGKEIVFMEAPDGTIFTDEATLRRVKRSDMYRELIETARKTAYESMKSKNDSCVDIYKSAPKLITEQEVIEERDTPVDFARQYYVIHEFSEPEPRESPFYNTAHLWAEKNVKTNIFNKRKKISQATSEKMKEYYEEAIRDWEKRKQEYIETEKKNKEIKDNEYEEEYNLRVAERDKTYELILNPTEDYIIDTVKDVLSQIQLPVDFSVDYAVSGRKIELDIDLPEIEDFPQKTWSILASGKLSVKQKSISELNKEYATGVIGMSFFFASLLFNISPAIEEISVAGYTQRINQKTGNIEDQYVYSVVFPRNTFSTLNIQNIDPIQAIANFEHKMDINSKFELRTINVKESENRKTDSNNQENQTEYYTVEGTTKENEPIRIYKDFSSSDNTSYNNSYSYSSSGTNSNTANYTPPKKNNLNELPWKIFKFGCLFLLILIVWFILSVLYKACTDPDPNPHHPYRGSQISNYEILV